MGNKRLVGPIEGLRNLALTLERLAVHEAASGAVRGAADGLREEIPELDGQVRAIVADALTVLGRLAHEAAERERVDPGAAAHTLAGAAMQGALEVLEREWQDGGMPLHAFVERINRLLDEVVEFAHSRTDEIRSPGERAQAMARGMVRAAIEELQEAVPTLVKNTDAIEGLFERAGRGLARGMAVGLREELASVPVPSAEALGATVETLAERTAAATVRGAGGALAEQGRRWREALRRDGTLRRVSRELTGGVLESLGAGLRRPLLAVAGAGSALVALSVLTVRWRAA
jgi:hypothetical protein